VLKVWREQSADDLSLRMLLLLLTGVSLWTVFGILKGDFPIIIGNGASLVLASALLALKLRFG
jgi:MtN3 and saliva related transmembrane protein